VVCLSLSVCVGRTASPAKTVEQIEVLFEGQNRVGSRNQVLNGCYVKCFFNSVKFILFGSFINFLTFYYKNVKCYHGTLAPLSEYDGSILAAAVMRPVDTFTVADCYCHYTGEFQHTVSTIEQILVNQRVVEKISV